MKTSTLRARSNQLYKRTVADMRLSRLLVQTDVRTHRPLPDTSLLATSL